MKTISSALQTFLSTASLTGMNRADLISILLPNGDTLDVLNGTNANITYSGNTYYSAQFGSWQRGPFSNSAASRPNAGSMELTAFMPIDGADAVFYPGTSTTLLSCANAGLFNGATVNIQTLFWPVGQTYQYAIANGFGTMKLNTGQIGNVKTTGRSTVTFDVYDMLYILNRQFPPHQIQSQCRHVLFDAGCTLLKSLFESTTVPLDATSTTLYLNLDVPAHQTTHAYLFGNLILVSSIVYMCTQAGTSAGSAPSFNSTRAAVTTDGTAKFTSMNQSYPLGYVEFTSGQNQGLSSSVKVQTTSSGLVQLQLNRPTPLPIAPGDLIKLVPGCNKSLNVCGVVFNNSIHFGGMPYVPNPESAGV